MLDSEIVSVLREFYPGMDLPLYSKTKKPERYGVTLTMGAKRIINSRKRKKKTEVVHVTFRATKEWREMAIKEFKKAGYPSMQAGMIEAVNRWIKERALPEDSTQGQMHNHNNT